MITKDALVFWNPWWSGQENWLRASKRESLPVIRKFLKRKEILTITGVRRSGKTTLFHLLIKELLDEGLKPEQILHVNLEDPAFRETTLLEVYKAYRDMIHPDGPAYLFLDEVQQMDDWQRDLRKLQDGFDEICLAITGSNSSLLKGEYASLLTGRTLMHENHPFSFRECVISRGLLDEFDEHLLLKAKSRLVQLFREYMAFGGFPEVLNEPDPHMKLMLLKEYYTAMVTRDVLARYPIRQAKKFETATHYFMSAFTGLFSAKKTGDVLGINMHTLEEYLGFLEDVYLMYPVAHFSYSLKQQLTYPRKIYGVDNGMINAVSFRFSEDLGKQLENLVFLEIRRRDCECYYWKGKKECDFLIKERERVSQAIQVTWSLKDAAVLKREVAGLMEALTTFDLPGGIILTYDEFDHIESGGRRIDVLPVWFWMLATRQACSPSPILEGKP
jgi:hypothetical protein